MTSPRARRSASFVRRSWAIAAEQSWMLSARYALALATFRASVDNNCENAALTLGVRAFAARPRSLPLPYIKFESFDTTFAGSLRSTMSPPAAPASLPVWFYLPSRAAIC